MVPPCPQLPAATLGTSPAGSAAARSRGAGRAAGPARPAAPALTARPQQQQILLAPCFLRPTDLRPVLSTERAGRWAGSQAPPSFGYSVLMLPSSANASAPRPRRGSFASPAALGLVVGAAAACTALAFNWPMAGRVTAAVAAFVIVLAVGAAGAWAPRLYFALRRNWPRVARLFWHLCLDKPSDGLRRTVLTSCAITAAVFLLLFAMWPEARTWTLFGTTVAVGTLLGYFGLRCCRNKDGKGKVFGAVAGYLLSLSANYLADSTARDETDHKLDGIYALLLRTNRGVEDANAKLDQANASIAFAISELGVQKRMMGALRREMDNGLLIVDIDPTVNASDQERSLGVILLSSPVPGTADEGPRRVALSPTAKALLERMAVTASQLDAYRSAVALSDFEKADRLAEEYVHRSGEERRQQDYAFYASQGDRYWTTSDFDMASDAYERALANGQGDWAILNKAGLSRLKVQRNPHPMEAVDRGVRLLRNGLDLARLTHKSDHYEVAASLSNVASALSQQGKPAEAAPFMEEAAAMFGRLYKGDHPRLATSIDNLGAIRREIGDAQGAEDLHTRSLQMRRRLWPGDHEDVATSMSNLAGAQLQLGKVGEAEALLREVLAMRQRLAPDDDVLIAESKSNLALAMERGDNLGDADVLHREALALYERAFPGDHPRVSRALSNVGIVNDRMKNFQAAQVHFERALAMDRRLYPGNHAEVAYSLNAVGLILAKQGREAEGIPYVEQAVLMAEAAAGKDAPMTVSFRNNLAKMRKRAGK